MTLQRRLGVSDHKFELDTEVVEYLAQLMDEEVNRTALAGVNNGRGDLGAVHLAAMFHRELGRV